MTTADIVALKSQAFASGNTALYHDCWLALGYDERYAFVSVLAGEQREALWRCEQYLARKEAA